MQPTWPDPLVIRILTAVVSLDFSGPRDQFIEKSESGLFNLELKDSPKRLESENEYKVYCRVKFKKDKYTYRHAL